MKISLAQINVLSGKVAENTAKMVSYIEKAKSENTDIVVFPEMTDTGYDMQVILEKATSWEIGTVPTLCAAAKQHHINVIAGVSEKIGTEVYNGIVVINRSGEIVGRYHKTHLITAEPMLEHHFLKAGDTLGQIEIEGHKIGLMTCYEIRFPEMARTLALWGAEVLIIPAAWPLVRLPHWENLIVARAIENQVYVAATSRLGNDTGVQFAGTSMIIGPYGNVMASGSQIHEALISADIDFEQINIVRSQIKVHQDRRTELYQL
ncbi:MAG: nitrilase-related carbon-nitrogen hydrolase [Flavipsychrobacter sp.]